MLRLPGGEPEGLIENAMHDQRAAEVLADFYEERGLPGDSGTARYWRARAADLRGETPTILQIERVRLDSGGYVALGGYVANGYDRGKYFGYGPPLFWVYDKDTSGKGVGFYIRARDRREAIAKVELKYPEAKIRGGSLKHRKYAKRKLY